MTLQLDTNPQSKLFFCGGEPGAYPDAFGVNTGFAPYNLLPFDANCHEFLLSITRSCKWSIYRPLLSWQWGQPSPQSFPLLGRYQQAARHFYKLFGYSAFQKIIRQIRGFSIS